ncbi:MAG: UDP-N-acetylmuramate--L-alanine ligase [Candidatus Marinimicrobia bacterium]|nr:UDP-N-acetylmuramate--L-alanine ligase [Candidatus Neomarinimicrobiota bacterium]
MFGKTKHIHFVGIGGIGMSGMAELLHSLGFSISGSDKSFSERTHHLSSLGIQIFEGHHEKNVKTCDVLVYSSAVRLDNPEIGAAQSRNIPVIRRAEMLGELLKLKPISIAVGGTHGKTTTSSMLGSVLTSANIHPTLVIGGIVNDLASNMITGSGDIILVEADEFDRSFLSLNPTMTIVTNIDLEHLDCYKNLEDLQSAFVHFANSVPFYGRSALCIDNLNVQSILPRIKRPVTTFGFTKQADVRAEIITYSKSVTTFDVYAENTELGTIILNVPGDHNILNALAAICLAIELEVSFEHIQQGLLAYSGVWRRFQILHETSENIMIIDDYAHHPSEVSATLQAARSGWNRRIIAVFQPHLFTRTKDFYEDFARAFLQADILIVTDIYPAREEPIEGVTAELITNKAREFGHKHAHSVSDKTEVASLIETLVQENDLIITMGAGDIWRQNEKIIEMLSL